MAPFADVSRSINFCCRHEARSRKRTKSFFKVVLGSLVLPFDLLAFLLASRLVLAFLLALGLVSMDARSRSSKFRKFEFAELGPLPDIDRLLRVARSRQKAVAESLSTQSESSPT